MIHADPTFTIHHAFEPHPLCSVIGLEGLMRTMSQLEPGLYMIRDGWAEVGTAERHESGQWSIEMLDGTKAGPGCVIV